MDAVQSFLSNVAVQGEGDIVLADTPPDTTTTTSTPHPSGPPAKKEIVLYYYSDEEEENPHTTNATAAPQTRVVAASHAIPLSEEVLQELRAEADEGIAAEARRLAEAEAEARLPAPPLDPTIACDFATGRGVPLAGPDAADDGLLMGLSFAEDLAQSAAPAWETILAGGPAAAAAAAAASSSSPQPQHGAQTMKVKRVAVPSGAQLPALRTADACHPREGEEAVEGRKRPRAALRESDFHLAKKKVFVHHDDGEDTATAAVQLAHEEVVMEPVVGEGGAVRAVRTLGGYCLTVNEADMLDELEAEDEADMLDELGAVAEDEECALAAPAPATAAPEEDEAEEEALEGLAEGMADALQDDAAEDDDEEEEEEDEALDLALNIAVIERLVSCCQDPELDPAIGRAAARYLELVLPALQQYKAGAMEAAALCEVADGPLRRFQKIFRSVYRPRDAPIVIDGQTMDF